jgi:hypothetical protein
LILQNPFKLSCLTKLEQLVNPQAHAKTHFSDRLHSARRPQARFVISGTFGFMDCRAAGVFPGLSTGDTGIPRKYCRSY